MIVLFAAAAVAVGTVRGTIEGVVGCCRVPHAVHVCIAGCAKRGCANRGCAKTCALIRDSPSLPLPPPPSHRERYKALRYEDDALASALCGFLVARALANTELGVYFFWFLRVESHDKTHGSMFRGILANYVSALRNNDGDGLATSTLAGSAGGTDNLAESNWGSGSTSGGGGGGRKGESTLRMLERQDDFVATLNALARNLEASKLARPKKIQALREELLASDGEFASLLNFDRPLTL